MRRLSCLVLAATAIGGDLLAQSNSRGTGYNGALYTIGSATYYGRRGAAYPNGEVGVAFMNGLCNPGSMILEWRAPMLPDHPKFSFITAKLVNDRMMQISDWSYIKHAFLSLNDPGTCGTCQNTASAQQMYVGCSDVYGASNNADRNYLGPPEELDPWLGTWNPIGSYFDRGFPDVGPPNNTNGVRNTINPTDSVMNRVTMKEADLVGVTSANLFFQIHVIHEGEPASNRGNNIMTRRFGLTWSGTTWSASTPSTTSGNTPTFGSVLTRWPGASVTDGGNGNDDGRFEIAVKVTGPTNGLWHYEYAVHNVDNHRGGASLRLPACASGRVQNLGFRDIDQNMLNDWTPSFTGGEIAWMAPANNPHNWNQILNFWFDSDMAPVAGTATIDQARLGAGALSVAVQTQVPGLQHGVFTGIGCGTPALELRANGVPSAGNAAFALDFVGAPSTGLFAFYSFGAGNLLVAPGCTQWLDGTLLGTHGFLMTDLSGLATIPLGVPAGFSPMDLHWQAASLITGGPIGSTFGLSNGLLVRLAGSTCQ